MQSHAAIEQEEPQKAIQPKSYAPPATGISFTVQKKENKTGLPDQLKSGIENLSGHAMDDVKVHYNSSQPAQLNAHAYAQGNQIHIAPGQEKHLAHEAWHVVQQKQGRVKPTKQLKSSVTINDSPALEKEADVMGAKAISLSSSQSPGHYIQKQSTHEVIQRVTGLEKDAKVKIFFRGGIKEGTIQSVSEGFGEEAYNIILEGEDNAQIVDQTFVFPQAISNDELARQISPLNQAIVINSHFGEKGIKNFNEPTQNGEHYAPRKLNGLRSEVPVSDNAHTVIAAAVKSAARLLSLHPFHDGNGRTALYYIYSDALKSGFEITMTPLEMHGFTLGEEQKKPIAEKQEAVIERIVSKCKKPGDEFDAEKYLADKLANLKNLETDRKSQQGEQEELRLKEQQERLQREKEEEGSEVAEQIDKFEVALGKANQAVKNLVEDLTHKNILFKKQEFGRNWMAFRFKKLKEMPAKSILKITGLKETKDLESIVEWMNDTFGCDIETNHFEEKEQQQGSDDDNQERKSEDSDEE